MESWESWNIFWLLQATVPEDGEAARDYEYQDMNIGFEEYGFPYYLCPCTFQEYEDYHGYASEDADSAEHAWCPCFQYEDNGDGREYAYEMEWPSQAAASNITAVSNSTAN